MTTLADVKKAANKIGATVSQEREGDMIVCRVMAPKDHHWSEGVHEFVDACYRPWKPDYDDLLSRMSYGIEPCDEHCEWWNEDED